MDSYELWEGRGSPVSVRCGGLILRESGLSDGLTVDVGLDEYVDMLTVFSFREVN